MTVRQSTLRQRLALGTLAIGGVALLTACGGSTSGSPAATSTPRTTVANPITAPITTAKTTTTVAIPSTVAAPPEAPATEQAAPAPATQAPAATAPVVVPTAPAVAPAPQTTARQGSVSYKSCADAKAAGAAPLRRGDPGYSSNLDRDGDGIACEK
ncbi:excalibur calcium-binding domain-containing protein [Nocardia yamanashiensis]|uniref:excalibur calcium-binding domain-containing protein n=1 Tax=Nocardia yamanashiensis TaxID=209247 RepID=UPI000A05DF9C|nr:excalibur calcium-binding domain-containing protein [Nocardia yamanashiensis]